MKKPNDHAERTKVLTLKKILNHHWNSKQRKFTKLKVILNQHIVNALVNQVIGQNTMDYDNF